MSRRFDPHDVFDRVTSVAKVVSNWIFSLLCLILALAYGLRVCSAVFVITGIIALPIGPICRLWDKYTPEYWEHTKLIVCSVLFVVAFLLAPLLATAPT